MDVTAVLLIAIQIVVIIESFLINDDVDCEQEFRLDDIKTITMNYRGGLHTNKCKTAFTLDSTVDYEMCIKPVSLNLNCNTEIEYHEFFVSDYSVDGILSCRDNHNITYDETCVVYVSSYWLVIKRKDSYYGSAESAEIRVYAKKRGESYSGSVSSAIIVPIIVGVVFGMLVLFIACYRVRQQRRLNSGTATYTVAASAPPANQLANQHSVYVQQSGQGNNVQADSGGYHVHPMVSAYPNQTQQSPAQYGNQSVPYNNQHTPYNNQPGQFNNQPVSYNNQTVSQQQQIGGIQFTPGANTPAVHPSAPSHGDNEMPPPSYESLNFK